MAISPAASAASLAARSPPLSRPVRSSSRTPAASASGASELEVLAGEDLGRRHQRRLPAGLDRGQHREERDQGLARADVALQQPVHPRRRRHVGGDLGDGARLRAGRRDRAARRAPGARSAAVAAGREALGALHPRAGDAPASAGARGARHRRAARAPARRARGRPAPAGRVRGERAPRCQSGQPRAGASGSARSTPAGPARAPAPRAPRGAIGLQRQPLGQRVDRLERRQRLGLVRAQDVVGMHHLRDAVEELDPARDDAALARPAASRAASRRGRGRRPAGTRSARRGRGCGTAGCGRWPGWCSPISTSTVTTSGSRASRIEPAAGGRPRRSAASAPGRRACWISIRAKSLAVFGPTPSSAVRSAKSGKRMSGRLTSPPLPQSNEPRQRPRPDRRPDKFRTSAKARPGGHDDGRAGRGPWRGGAHADRGARRADPGAGPDPDPEPARRELPRDLRADRAPARRAGLRDEFIRAEGTPGDSDRYPRWNLVARREGARPGALRAFQRPYRRGRGRPRLDPRPLRRRAGRRPDLRPRHLRHEGRPRRGDRRGRGLPRLPSRTSPARSRSRPPPTRRPAATAASRIWRELGYFAPSGWTTSSSRSR